MIYVLTRGEWSDYELCSVVEVPTPLVDADRHDFDAWRVSDEALVWWRETFRAQIAREIAFENRERQSQEPRWPKLTEPERLDADGGDFERHHFLREWLVRHRGATVIQTGELVVDGCPSTVNPQPHDVGFRNSRPPA